MPAHNAISTLEALYTTHKECHLSGDRQRRLFEPYQPASVVKKLFAFVFLLSAGSLAAESSGLSPATASASDAVQLAAAGTTAQPFAAPPPSSGREVNPGTLDISLANEARAAIHRGLDWLVQQQHEDGHWSNPAFPALTALPLWALANAGNDNAEAVAGAVSYLLSCVQDDGGIYHTPSEPRKGGGLSNYNTALSMVALHALGDPDLAPVIQRARHFVAQGQHLGQDIYYGGMGYDADTGRAYADLSNSYVAFEAMRLTEAVEDLESRKVEHAGLDWDAAIQFLQRVQNLPQYNDQPWATEHPDHKGGFAYRPDHSMAGSFTNAHGVVKLRSYGSMTYAGLLSFIYARVDRNDPRVQAAYDWALKFWTLDENPGMGKQGLYYYYNTLAKALAVYGKDILRLADGERVNWRTQLIKKLVSLQKIEPATGAGYWVNEEGRWWESDPVLVTAYSILALQAALSP